MITGLIILVGRQPSQNVMYEIFSSSELVPFPLPTFYIVEHSFGGETVNEEATLHQTFHFAY
jgi:hypothetical protein